MQFRRWPRGDSRDLGDALTVHLALRIWPLRISSRGVSKPSLEKMFELMGKSPEVPCGAVEGPSGCGEVALRFEGGRALDAGLMACGPVGRPDRNSVPRPSPQPACAG